MLRHHYTVNLQIRYQFLVTMVWVSYVVAICKSAGEPPKNYSPDSSHWHRWCNKCRLQKPARTHHCKSCNRCVLQMDHHCPWTLNCVGHGNMPHFLRFLVWVIVTTAYTVVVLSLRAAAYYRDRNLPAYLARRSEMVAVIVLLPLDAFVCLSIIFLFIRCMIHVVTGTTQIEEWEKERIANQISSLRFWDKVRANYRTRHGCEMPELESWIRPGSPITADDVVFPYDQGFYKNVTNALGSPSQWLLPWGGPSTDGVHHEVVLDEQLDLPWPPDGGFRNGGEPHVYSEQWRNDMGETLEDYGVEETGREAGGA